MSDTTEGNETALAEESLESVRQEADDWLDHFRDHANPQTTEERWEYLDEAAVLIERLIQAQPQPRADSGAFFKEASSELLALLDSAWKRESEMEQEISRLYDELAAAQTHSRVCPVCNGYGSIPGFFLGTVKTCTSCHGRGRQ